jgi:formate hydrogenlyase subunit 4
MHYVLIIIQILFVPIMAPLAVGVTRKVKAFMQGRQGASILQPYRNLAKLFQKDEVVSHDASMISRVAPYVVFASMLAIGALIPILPFGAEIGGLHGDFIVVISFVVLATFFIALYGLDAGNAFGGLGASREMTIASLTEAGLFFSILPLALLAGSTNLSSIFAHTGAGFADNGLVYVFAFFAFFIALLAENARYPFDNPSTHLELTMVHEAMIIEASGPSLGLFEWASASKLLIFILLGVNIFFPWGVAIYDLETGIFAFGALLMKIVLLSAVIGLLESTTAKLRFFRLPNLLLTSFVLGVIALVLAAF